MLYISVIAVISYYIATHYTHIKTTTGAIIFTIICVLIFFTPMKK